MPVQVEVSTTVERPLATVWEFYATRHVENHPRWDPDLELEKLTDGPIGLGTVIKRRSVRSGRLTDGTMEVVEFEPMRAMGMRIRDGPMETNGRATFTPEGPSRTSVAIKADFPALDDSMAEAIRPLMERSAQNIKQLIELET